MAGKPCLRLHEHSEPSIATTSYHLPMHEGDEHNMPMNWVVSSDNSMEMHGYLGDEQEPTIRVKTSGTGMWTFQYIGMKGQGRIQVTKGCDYNPLDLIESLFHHVTGMERETAINPKAKTIEMDESVIQFDNGFRDDWV